MAEAIIRDQLKILGTLGSGAGNPILTRDPVTKLVKEVPPIDPSTYVTTALPQGYLLVGNASNIATAVPVTGAISVTPAGLTSLANDYITNVHINSGAAISYSKLNLTGAVVNNDIAAVANISRSKLASGNTNRLLINDGSGVMAENSAITINRVLISDGSGLPTASAMTAANLLFLDTGATSLTTLLSNKLEFSSGITPVDGDIIYFDTTWQNLAIGTAGQVLTVSGGGLPVWGSAAANGLPTGGTAGQYLRKTSGTNYDAAFAAIATTEISGVTASSADINILTGASGAGVTAAELLHINGVTSNIQTQIDLKLDRTLTENFMFVGNASNVATPMATGANGYVLTSVGGVPAWVSPGAGGTVTYVQVSGGTTGLSATGGPITTSGTITLSGVLIAVNGGTGFASYTVGDILYANTTTTLAKLAAGTAAYVLTSNGAGVAPSWQVLPSSGHIIENSGTPLTARANLNFTNGLTASDNTPDTDVKWGGVISGDTYVYPDVDDTRAIVIGQDAGNSFTANSVALIANDIFLGSYTSANSIGLNASGSIWQNSTGVFQLQDMRAGASAVGIEYFADYSANFTIRSLIDKGYADGAYWSLASGGTLTGANTISGAFTVDFANDGVVVTGVNSSTNKTFRVLGTMSANNIFLQSWEDKSGNIRMSFGDISTSDASPALKICAVSRLQNVELALVQNVGSANARDYGGFFDIQPTTSDFTWTRRVNLVDTEALRIANSDGTVTIPGKVTMTNANGANLTLSQNNSTNFTVSNVNSGANATAGIVITGQNGSINISKYSSTVSTYKILTANSGNFYNSNGNMNFLSDATTSSINFAAGGSTTANFTIHSGGGVVVNQSIMAAAWASALAVTPGAHTSMTAATEFVSNDFVGASQQWLAGTVTTQRFNYFRGFTVTGASATNTITNAYTVYIDPSVVGANAAITNNWALGLNGGIKTNTGSILFGNSSGDVVTASTRLDVRASGGGVGDFGLRIADNSNNLRFTIAGNGAFNFNNALTLNSRAFTYTATGSSGVTFTNASPNTSAAGSYVGLYSDYSFSPASGTATLAMFSLFGTINQTGGANGAVTIVSLTPTYTAAGGDVRGIYYNPSVTSIAGVHYSFDATSGLMRLPASVAGSASFRIPHGTAPSSPVDGDFWSTTAGFYARVNGATVGPFGVGGGGISNSAAADEMMKSNGTNAVPSGTFSTVAGDLTFGTGLAGANRTLTATGSATDVGLILATKGIGELYTPAITSLGTASIAGDRTIQALSSDTNSTVEIISKGTGPIRLVNALVHLGNAGLAGASRAITVLGSAADIGIVLTPKGAGFVDIASGASFRLLGGTQSITYSDATTNTVVNLLQLTRQTSGTPAVGMGVGLMFSTQSFNGSIIESVSTDLTGASEDFDLVLKNMAGGAVAAEKLRIKSTGQLQLANYTGSGSFSGTPVGYLQFDSSGNIITAAVPSGGGNVSNTGTPADNQIAVWTTSTVIEGTANLTFDGTTFTVNGGTIIGTAATQNIFNTAATTVNIAGAATTFNVGGTPTGAITANIFANATAAATKTINIGTAGGSTSTVAINIGTGSTGTAVNVTIGTGTIGTTQINGATTSIASTTVTMSAATTVNVNGASPSFVSSSTGTLTFFNTNIVTVSAWGAATTLTIGATTGTMNLRNATIVLTQTPATDAGFSTSTMLVRDSSGNLDKIVASGGGTTNFLRADGTWAAPPNPIGIHDMWIPATAIYPKTTAGAGGATQSELATSLVNLQCLQFTSTSADENAQFVIAMPRNWNNGTITFRVHWTATSGTGVVRWALRAAAYSNDDLMTTSNWGTAIAVDDTLTVVNDLHVADRSSAMTVGGTPADEDLIVFEITRVGSNGADTFSGTALLIGISLAITTDAATAA